MRVRFGDRRSQEAGERPNSDLRRGPAGDFGTGSGETLDAPGNQFFRATRDGQSTCEGF